MTPTKQNWAQRTRARNWVFVGEIVAVAATVIALVIAAAGLWAQIIVNKKTLQEIEDTALARSWTLLTTPAPGNSGKVEAMEYLASKQQPLDGIDLSCETMGGVEKDEQGEAVCVRQPYLRSLDLSEATHGWKVSLIAANLSGADLRYTNLSGALLINTDLSGAILWNVNLSGAYLERANLSDADLMDANLSDADLSGADLSDADLLGANLSDANLSGANFKDALRIESANLTAAWAWVNRPPLNLPSDIYDTIDLCVFQNGLKRENRPDPCIRLGADLSGADLSGAILSRADLSGRYLLGANLSDAELAYANLSGARLWNADLSGTNFQLTNLSGANLSDAEFKDALGIETADFTDA